MTRPGIYFDKEYAQAEYEMHVNRTSRSNGAVGRDPVCYRAAREQVLARLPSDIKHFGVLDFGCGKGAKAGKALFEWARVNTNLNSYSMRYYDIGDNTTAEARGSDLPQGYYDLVILSNVLNVQPTDNLLKLVLLEAWACVAEGGILLCNYPKKPRHCGVSDQQMWELLAALSPCAKNSLGQYYLASPNKGVYQITKGSS